MIVNSWEDWTKGSNRKYFSGLVVWVDKPEPLDDDPRWARILDPAAGRFFIIQQKYVPPTLKASLEAYYLQTSEDFAEYFFLRDWLIPIAYNNGGSWSNSEEIIIFKEELQCVIGRVPRQEWGLHLSNSPLVLASVLANFLRDYPGDIHDSSHSVGIPRSI